MSEDARKKVDVKPDKTVIKALSQGGLLGGTGEVMVDVKDGKILRIRPFHFDWKYDGASLPALEDRAQRRRPRARASSRAPRRT